MIHNKWTNSIKEVIPVCDRIISITINGSCPLTIISAYAPPANHKDTEKKLFTRDFSIPLTNTKPKDLPTNLETLMLAYKSDYPEKKKL